MLSLVKLRSSFERPQLRVAAPNQLRGMPKANASAFTGMLRRIINSHKVNEIRRQKSKLNTAHATTQSVYNDNTEYSTSSKINANHIMLLAIHRTFTQKQIGRPTPPPAPCCYTYVPCTRAADIGHTLQTDSTARN